MPSSGDAAAFVAGENGSDASALHRFLRSRRSVRRFLPRPIPAEVVNRLLETATWAPSAHHRQPWRFVAFTSQEVKVRLGMAMGEDFRRDLLADGHSAEAAEILVERSRLRMFEAPLVIVLCLELAMGDPYPDAARQQAEYLMGVQSVALAGGSLLLAAHAEGLGGVWGCAPLFAQDTVRRTLELPASWEPQGMLFLGYPAKTPIARPRQPMSEVTRFL